MPPNYQNGKIYMIESLEGDCKYYGSTIQSLALRLGKHRSEIKMGKNITSKEVLKYSDARILLVESFPCNNRMELESKEAEYIRHNDCVNKCIPQRTDKQYYQDNKEVITEKQKQYRQDNKEVIAKYKKQHYQDNKEVIAKYKKQHYQDNKEVITEKTKQYYQDNKEVITEKQKQHYQDNKDKKLDYIKQYRRDNKEIIAEKQNKKCLCDCGKEYTYINYKRHQKSKRHQFWQKTYDFIYE
jgi:hypothetical protein